MTLESYYKQHQTPDLLLKKKMELFDHNSDIKEEFEYWINNGKYVDEDPIEIEGYTAGKLAELSKYLKGEGAFIMLIELRDNPKAALKKIIGKKPQ